MPLGKAGKLSSLLLGSMLMVGVRSQERVFRGGRAVSEGNSSPVHVCDNPGCGLMLDVP